MSTYYFVRNNDNESFEDYRKTFEELSVNSVVHIHQASCAGLIEDVELLEKIEKADGIFCRRRTGQAEECFNI